MPQISNRKSENKVVKDFLARGLDIERRASKYYWIMPSFVGIANLVDGLYAIGQLVQNCENV